MSVQRKRPPPGVARVGPVVKRDGMGYLVVQSLSHDWTRPRPVGLWSHDVSISLESPENCYSAASAHNALYRSRAVNSSCKIIAVLHETSPNLGNIESSSGNFSYSV